jgi:hypothetical protein
VGPIAGLYCVGTRKFPIIVPQVIELLSSRHLKQRSLPEGLAGNSSLFHAGTHLVCCLLSVVCDKHSVLLFVALGS